MQTPAETFCSPASNPIVTPKGKIWQLLWIAVPPVLPAIRIRKNVKMRSDGRTAHPVYALAGTRDIVQHGAMYGILRRRGLCAWQSKCPALSPPK
jgi:hypothetical protein